MGVLLSMHKNNNPKGRGRMRMDKASGKEESSFLKNDMALAKRVF